VQSFIAGQANRVRYDLTNRSTGAPITAGTVNAYLQAMSGSNSGKWFRGSDSSWQATAAIAAVAAHDDDGHWYATIATAAWTDGVRYSTYAKETGDLHISVSEEVAEIDNPANITIEPEVEQ
jgi:hypothetical protein